VVGKCDIIALATTTFEGFNEFQIYFFFTKTNDKIIFI
jgi:hypothetical protein